MERRERRRVVLDGRCLCVGECCCHMRQVPRASTDSDSENATSARPSVRRTYSDVVRSGHLKSSSSSSAAKEPSGRRSSDPLGETRAIPTESPRGRRPSRESPTFPQKIVFCEERRSLPSLARGWRTPDPSPTRYDHDLPKCAALAEVLVDSSSDSSSNAGEVIGGTVIRLPSRTPSPVANYMMQGGYFAHGGDPRITPRHSFGAAFPIGHAAFLDCPVGKAAFPAPAFTDSPVATEQGEGSPGQADEANPQSWESDHVPFSEWLEQEEKHTKQKIHAMEKIMNLKAANDALKSALQSSTTQASTVHSFQPAWLGVPVPASSSSDAWGADPICLPSRGSAGHPTSCAAACKYFRKANGCKDGANCDRCHICEWTTACKMVHPRDSDERTRSRWRKRRSKSQTPLEPGVV